MPGSIGSYAVLAAGVFGVVLGLYGMVPALLRAWRPASGETAGDEEDIVARELALVANERQRARAFGALVGIREDAIGGAGFGASLPTTGLPGTGEDMEGNAPWPGWETPLPVRPSLTQAILDSTPRARSFTEPSPDPAPETEEALDETVLQIFEEVDRNRPPTVEERSRALLSGKAEAVPIDELLADARWTARGLRPNPATGQQ